MDSCRRFQAIHDTPEDLLEPLRLGQRHPHEAHDAVLHLATFFCSSRPELRRFMAKRIGAKSIVEVKASHVPYVSQPDAVVKLIEAAAQ